MDNTYDEKMNKISADIKKLRQKSERRMAKYKKLEKMKVKLSKNSISLPKIGESIKLQEKQLTSIAAMLANHDYEIRENIVTKNDLYEVKNEIMNRFDEMFGILKDQKQETAMIQYRTQENTNEIARIKPLLNLK